MTPIREPYLIKQFPGLRGRLPWLDLGRFPTPVLPMNKLQERLGCGPLHVKRDDLSGEVYGGNKVRKLEFTLADALKRKRNPVITIGAVGSNHVLATTIYARKVGLDTIGVFVPQPVQENLRANILCNCVQGCRIEYAASDNRAFFKVVAIYLREWIKNRGRPYLLWIGGSSRLGVLGYVEGALELAAQVKEGMLPEPEYIFTPAGSAGTLAGLILGLKLAGLASRPVGVRVVEKSFTNEKTTAFMANRALAYLRRLDPAVPAFTINSGAVLMLHDYFGRRYAQYTTKGVAAINMARELEGLKLEGTYSGKAMAGLMEFMSRPENKNRSALFINTYNSIPLDPLLASCPGPEILPAAVREYFQKDIAPVED